MRSGYGLLFLPIMLLYGLGSVADEAGPVAWLHGTDLFRPHNDPDDHWDLACAYALAYRGEVDLRAVLIDAPPDRNPQYNPDIHAVSQLNLLTGLSVPVLVGSPGGESAASSREIRAILRVLEESPRPMVIHVIGSCRDIALAGQAAPDLFAKKCKAIYLNAGTGSPDPAKAAQMEYNVALDPASYAAMFSLPCPIYWMPCFEEIGDLGQLEVRAYGTHYKFQQKTILPHLSAGLQAYFAYMFGQFLDHNWYHYLEQDPDSRLILNAGEATRHMWCTGGFFHAAGYGINAQGEQIPSDDASSVFQFEPIQMTCTPDGVTHWQPATESNRFLFHIQNTEDYANAMTQAMKPLLLEIP
ncbi:MAG: hypothetical protein RBU29_02730 [bacterium]|jgi:hypothetical protein|nr:hypothetical protein [bacterium]